MISILGLLISMLALTLYSSFYLYATPLDETPKAPKAYRTITDLHTSFSQDANLSEPNLQLKNL
ncbi:MAG: hypothetical protein ACE5KO_03840, partial [Candidatus Bathyarchaeia archaeon]